MKGVGLVSIQIIIHNFDRQVSLLLLIHHLKAHVFDISGMIYTLHEYIFHVLYLLKNFSIFSIKAANMLFEFL